MDLCQQELEKLAINNDDCDVEINSDSDSTVRGRRPSSVRSDPFDEELPKDFSPRKLEWFFNPRPDPKKPISMFWTDHESFYDVPAEKPESTETSGELEEKLGTMGLLEKMFVPQRKGKPDSPKWTVGAPLPNLTLRRVSLDANDISHFSLARPPTPPRKSSRSPGDMSNKPLPPLPRPRRFVSVGDQPLFARSRSQSTPDEFTPAMNNASQPESTAGGDFDSIIDAYNNSTAPEPSDESTPSETQPHVNGQHVPGPYLLHRLHQYQQDQLEGISHMEVALSNPHVKQSLRNKFLSWSQQLLDLNFPFRVTTHPAFGEEIKITERDAHSVVDWAIEVGTKMNATQDHIYDCLNMGAAAQAELRAMCDDVDIYNDPPLPVEELYHKMAEVIHKKLRSPRVHEINLLTCFHRLFDSLLYISFQQVKDRVVVVRNERPHEPVQMPLNIDTPLTLLKRVLVTAFDTYTEYTELTRAIRNEFFVPIEHRIPGVSSRTKGYLNNVVGPSNVI